MAEIDATADGAAKRPARRGSRGGRGRGRGTAAGSIAADEETSAAIEATTPEPEPEPAAISAPARSPRRIAKSKPAPEVPAEAVPVADVEPVEAAPEPARRSRRGSGRQAAEAKAHEDGAAPEVALPARPTPRHETRDQDSSLVRAIEQQSRQIEQLIEAVRRGGGGATTASAAPPPRVGVFVDAANVELASDRLRARFDWAKILGLLTRDRQLVRAIAYSPVHDDPGVSIETQRFVEPFLGKGYKVVTKPLKRFQDGTIKANVDIEMALDVMEMLDRLDVVCLISGDGDFQRLVEVVQSKGVRVEVVAVGNSAAGNLRNAADHFIDLQQRLREVRV